jgi:hypothetical protein
MVTRTRRMLDPELTILGGRDLVGLVGRLVREQSWEILTDVFSAIGEDGGLAHVALSDLDAATRLCQTALGKGARAKPRTAFAEELRALRLAAAEALLARTSRPPLGELERSAFERAGLLLGEAGDHRRAARVYEELGDDPRAAEAWGALGDLERMEAALERDERRASDRREAVEAMRRFEALLTGGERRAALLALAGPARVEEIPTALAAAARIEGRLVAGRAVTLRAAGGPSVRVAGLPAALGRDRAAEVPLRDPAVSRRHALLKAAAGGISIEDAGSRGGVRIAGARLESQLVLRGSGELGLGATVPLRYVATEGAVVFEGTSGLDRPLRALVGVEPIPLALVFPSADGLDLAFEDGGPRLLRRPDLQVRVEGHFIGPTCDLLHGDVVEVVGPRPLRLEVE